jgi:hypothetical protein
MLPWNINTYTSPNTAQHSTTLELSFLFWFLQYIKKSSKIHFITQDHVQVHSPTT